MEKDERVSQMIKTKVTEMLGCKYPIIAGTMARISNPNLLRQQVMLVPVRY
jgi:NAD(P)H-dependent flavin oxidoreductase YrpB (nitropropane dioxygenase family)